MLHYKLIDHSEKCLEKKKKSIGSTFGISIPCHIKTKLFLLKGQFILVTMNSCKQHLHSDLDFMEYLINSCAENTLKKHKKIYYNTERSIVLDKNWKNKKNRERLFNERHEEVNYIYYDNAGKKYGICTTYDFGTYIGCRVDFCNEYKKTIKYIDENFEHQEKENLSSLSKELYENNNVYQLYDTKLVMRTTEELISNIKNKIK